MGGRLDAPMWSVRTCTVITRIGLEHVEFLGDTLAKISYRRRA